jgi:hypothetical protein
LSCQQIMVLMFDLSLHFIFFHIGPYVLIYIFQFMVYQLSK